MISSTVDMPAIKAKLDALKATYPRKRGLRLFLGMHSLRVWRFILAMFGHGHGARGPR